MKDIELYKTMPPGFVKEAFDNGWKRGYRKGYRKGVVKSILQVLHIRFGEIPPEITKTLKETKSVATLKGLLPRVITCSTLDEFTEALPK